ncbi:MAG: phosphate ABC transporter substrate-binding protein PstS [Propionibacteriaceae bacterium]|nr:phosphate ABC transporter substrate-binding protein PstS [Propionibacteriaceae bacterium]
MSTTRCVRRVLVRSLAIPIALCAALLASSCALNERPVDPSTDSGVRGTLNGMGASSMSVAQENWIAQFQTAHARSTVIYAPEGSGAGRDAFMGGGTDFAGSDRAFSVAENVVGAFAACAADSSALDLPLYISPIAIVFNVDGVSELNLTPEVLASIFAGDVSTWSDKRIAALNPDAELPDLQVSAVHRSDDSGTTANFTGYLSAAAGSIWESAPSGAWPFNSGEAAKGTSGVVSAVRGGVGTIGYVDASQAGELPTARIGRGGAFEAPTPEAAALAVESSPIEEGRAQHDVVIALDAEAPGYPIVLVSYVIACERYRDADKAELVRTYLGYVASVEGQNAAAAGAGAAPLTERLRTLVLAAIESVR